MVNWFKYSSPGTFYPLAGTLRPWFLGAAAILFPVALWFGLVVAPTDAQQGESYRIMFIHVATATLSMLLYLVMAGYCALSLIFNTRLSAMMAQAIAPTGAWFTFIALWTGALWGKPTWGTYWVWDARITSELILLFLYVGFLALTQAIEDPRRADRAGALLALVGVINVPIIYFSVRWWNTLHQGASITVTSAPKIAQPMLIALVAMLLACWAYAFATAFQRVRCIILEREAASDWVRALNQQGAL
ncbi:MAG: heme ABC transporter permease CcmC [Casimicrobiaceae bacterium]